MARLLLTTVNGCWSKLINVLGKEEFMKIFGIGKSVVFGTDPNSTAGRARRSDEHSQLVASLDKINFDDLPENEDTDETALAANEQAQPQVTDATTIDTAPEVARIAATSPTVSTYQEVNTDLASVVKADEDFELDGYIASVSQGNNHITLFDELGNVVYTGSRDTALKEFLSLSPEELAGIYGSSGSALVDGLSAIDDLVSDDATGVALNLLEKNSALSASYLAYVHPNLQASLSEDAISMVN